MNHTMRYWRAMALILVLSLTLSISGDRLLAQSPSLVHKVILRARDRAGREALRARNARLVSDYGAFSLWTIEGGDVTALGTMSTGISFHPEFDRLLLREATLDTGTLLPGASAQAGSGTQLYMVQFAGPIRDK